MSDLNPYVYKNLTSKDAVRVLKIRPANLNQEDIDCELVESPSEPYEALSLYWGKQAFDRFLRIHDADQVYSFKISRSISYAVLADV